MAMSAGELVSPGMAVWPGQGLQVEALAPQQLRNAAWCLQLARSWPMLQVEGIVIMASCCLACSQCMLI